MPWGTAWATSWEMSWVSIAANLNLLHNPRLRQCERWWRNSEKCSTIPFNSILNNTCRIPSWWKQTGNTAESLFDRKQWKPKSSIWPIQNGTAAEQKSLITSSTPYDQTSNPTHTYSRTEIPIKSNILWAFSPCATITRTQRRDRYRWPILSSGFETYGETQNPVWETSRPSRNKCKRCMAKRTTNSTRQWSVLLTSSKERMN